MPPKNPGANLSYFFDELAKYWQQASDSTTWVPGLFENNLLCFELRDEPQLLPGEKGWKEVAKEEVSSSGQKLTSKTRTRNKRDLEKEKRRRKAARKAKKRNR